MDFTREPIIESIITAKDGHRIVVRSSKNVGHEEYFVDALEVISFGSSVFFRSSERPRPFLVPANDYEVLEVREPRVALKAPSIAGTVRIGPTKEIKESVKEPQRETPREQPNLRQVKESKPVREMIPPPEELVAVEEDIEIPPQPRALEIPLEESIVASQSERLQERKKDRRGRLRRRKGGREESGSVTSQEEESTSSLLVKEIVSDKALPPVVPATLLPPPMTLIRDDIERLRKDETFKGAFYLKDDLSGKKEGDDDDAQVIPERLMVQEEEPGEEIPDDSYKATPAKVVVRDFREPFWIPPRAEEQPKPPEGV